MRLESRGKTTGHGTCFVLRGLVITAAHLIDERPVYVEVSQDNWIRISKILFKDEGLDLAILLPEQELKDTKIPDHKETICYASIEAKEVKKLEVKYSGEMPEFNHGGSGSPIYANKKLVGLAQAYRIINNKEVPQSVVVLPSGVIFRVLDSL